ncbi:MAG: hypothetical protein L6Q76_13295 [Polyangiaceae bacterium]|nr:hypothetical protein [Polyangiaceae bacterium]
MVKAKVSGDDPERGEWTLEEAPEGLKDVKDANALIATREVSEGSIPGSNLGLES